MPTPLPDEEVLRIARLARLALAPDERALLANQLGDILAFAAQVAALDTSRVAPADNWFAEPSLERPDEPRPSLEQELALANAPEQAVNLFLTPRVLLRD